MSYISCINSGFRFLTLLILISFFTLNSAGSVSSTPSGDTDFEGATRAKYDPRVLRIDDESDVEYLESIGARILFRRGDILLTLIPVNQGTGTDDEVSDNKGLNSISRILKKGKKRFSFNRDDRNFITPALLEARPICGAQSVIDGELSGKSYTGEGVVVGFCDIGFDPMHIAFTSADGQSSRISRIVQYKETSGIRLEMSTPEEYAEWATDTLSKNHATHVAGILAGGYRDNGYYGTAPDAEIVATLSQLSSVGLLAGVEEIIAYAKSKGKTPVINLSMGNYTGPHDGTSLFSQYLDRCAEDAIIVLSAGNAGNIPLFAQHLFQPGEMSIVGRLNNKAWDNYQMYGITDFWSLDNKGFTFTPLIYDEDTGKIVYRMETLSLEDFNWWGTCTQQALAPYFGEPDEELSRYFKGYMEVIGGVDPDNGRYNLQWGYDMQTSEKVANGGNWARYNLAFEIGSEIPGTQVYIYADGTYTKLKAHTGGLKPNSLGSISDLACGHKIVSVGMCNTRSEMFYMDGTTKQTDRAPGTVNINSSYGTLIDGRTLPLTVAPGADVISAASLPYALEHNQGPESFSLAATVDGKTHYWIENLGTSMSAPYVAGCIATWLQAAPSLKADDVIDIIKKSNTHDYTDPDNPRHGAGWLDSQEAIRLALEKNAVTRVETESDGIPLEYIYENKVLTVLNPLSLNGSATVYRPDGRKENYIFLSDNRTKIDFNNYAKGIYIVKLECGNNSKGVKIVVN